MKKLVIFLTSSFSISLLFCAGISAIAIQLFVHDCLWWECVPERNFRISDLELPSTLFPNGAIVNHIYPMSDEFETIEDGIQSIFWANGKSSAANNIYRYATIKKAMDGFEFNRHLLDAKPGGIWTTPVQLTFSSRTANAVYVACRYWGIKECGMVARYQEYVVSFDATMDDEMTYPKFEKILVFIDEQISMKIFRYQ